MFPVFVLAKDSGEVTKFDSVNDLQNAIERIDVENREYEVWDCGGGRLAMAVQEPIWLVLSDSDSTGETTLRDALARYAASINVDLTTLRSADPLVIYDHIHRVADARRSPPIGRLRRKRR